MTDYHNNCILFNGGYKKHFVEILRREHSDKYGEVCCQTYELLDYLEKSLTIYTVINTTRCLHELERQSALMATKNASQNGPIMLA